MRLYKNEITRYIKLLPSATTFPLTACSQALFGNTLVSETLFHAKQKLLRKLRSQTDTETIQQQSLGNKPSLDRRGKGG